MTQKEKDLLFKDLCSRLPYGVKCENFNQVYGKNVFKVTDVRDNGCICGTINNQHSWTVFDPLELKPYLFPLKSMTAEQLYELREMFGFEIEFDNIGIEFNGCLSYLEMDALFEWLDRHHFDYRELIPKGLALDASNLNIY